MNEVEIQRLVVRLLGENEQFVKMMEEAIASVTKAAGVVEKEATKVEHVTAAYDAAGVAAKASAQAADKVAVSTKAAGDAAQKTTDQMSALEAEERRMVELQKFATNVIQGLTTQEEHYGTAVKRLMEAEAAGLLTQEQYNQAMVKLKQTLPSVASQLQQAASGMVIAGSAITALGAAITGSLMVMQSQAINAAKDFEQTMVSFGAFLGSELKAAKMLKELQEFSAKTPFEMPTLLSATKMLLQFGVAADKVIPTLKAIGDVTGGADPNKVQMMAYAFSQMSAAGRLMGQDLMQMVNAGFNPLNEMAKTTGKSLSQLREEMSQGKISADMVMEAFQAASKRLNLMEQQSQTAEGRASTLRDNIALLRMEIGNALLPLYGLWVDGLAAVVGWFRNLDPGVKSAIAYTSLFVAGLGIAVTTIGGLVTGMAALLSLFGGLLTVLPTVAVAIGAVTAAQVQQGISSTALIGAIYRHTTATVTNTAANVASSTATKLLTASNWIAAASWIGAKVALVGYQVGLLAANAAQIAYTVISKIVAVVTIIASLGFAVLTGTVAAFATAIWTAVAGMTAFAAITVIGLAIIAIVAAAAYAWYKAQQSLNKEIERSKKLTEELITTKNKLISQSIQQGNTLEGKERLDYFKSLADRTQREAERAEENAKRLRETADAAAPTWKSLWLAGRGDWKIQDAQASQAEEIAKNAKDSAQKAKDAMLEAGGQVEIQGQIDALTKNTDTYQKAIDDTQAKIKELSQIDNPTAQQQEDLKKAKQSVKEYQESLVDAQAEITRLEKMKEGGMSDEYKKEVEAVNKRIETAGMTDTEKKVHEFQKNAKGEVGKELIDEYRLLAAQAEAAEKIAETDKGIQSQIEQAQKSLAMGGKFGKTDREMKVAQERVKIDEAAALGAPEEKVAEMEKNLLRLADLWRAQDQQAFNDQIKQSVKNFHDQAEAAKYSGAELEVYKARADAAKKGLTLSPEQEQDIRNAFNQNAIAQIFKDLEEQAQKSGKTAEQLTLYELAQRSATDADIQRAKALQEQAKHGKLVGSIDEYTKSLEKETQMLQWEAKHLKATNSEKQIQKFLIDGATEAEVAKARAAAKANDAAAENKKLMEAGLQIHKKYMTPQQKFAEGQTELDKMLKAGAITRDEYNKELQELHKQTSKDYTVKTGIQGVDAVVKGSAQAAQHLAEYYAGKGVAMGFKPRLTPSKETTDPKWADTSAEANAWRVRVMAQPSLTLGQQLTLGAGGVLAGLPGMSAGPAAAQPVPVQVAKQDPKVAQEQKVPDPQNKDAMERIIVILQRLVEIGEKQLNEPKIVFADAELN